MHHDVLEGSCLPEEDIEAVKCIDPATLQTWCMSRVADYRKRIAAVRQRQESLRKEFYTFSDETHDTSSPTANAGHAEEEDPTGISTLGVDELKSRVRALRTLYNTAAPINRYLPAELLMSIFAMLGPTAHRSRRRGVSYPKLFRICRFWRTLLLQATEFWASMLATRHDVTHLSARRLRLYEMALQHSCNRALSLSLYRCPERLVDAIIPHAHRIIELEVTTEECTDDPVVNRLLATAMPMLQRLEVTPWYGWAIPSDVCLRHLHTLRIPPGCFTPHLAGPSLRDVELVSQSYRTATGRDSILQGLTQCPNLRSLVITCNFPISPTSTTILPPSLVGTVIDVPSLRMLQVNWDSALALAILSLFKLPDTATIVLSSLEDFQLPGPTRTHRAINGADRVSFHLLQGIVLETFVGDTRMLHMSTRPRYPQDRQITCTAQIADMFSSSHAVTSLSIGLYGNGEKDLAVLLNSFPSLTHLAFPDEGAPISHLISCNLDVFLALSTPRDTDGGYPCPKLRSLNILWRTYFPLPHRPRNWPGPTEIQMHNARRRNETEDRRTWAPYGVRETREYCMNTAKCLKMRIPPLPPLQDLCIYIEVAPASLEDAAWIQDITSELEQQLASSFGTLVERVRIKAVSR